LNNRGLAHFATGHFRECKNDYIGALEQDSTNPEYLFNLGTVLLEMREADEAHVAFDKAMELDRSSAKLWHAKGLVFERESTWSKEGMIPEKDEQAIRCFKMALDLQPDFAPSSFHLGQAFHRSHHFQAALHCFKNVLEHKQKNFEVLLARG